MKKKVLGVIEEIEAEKRALGVEPDYATDVEVRARMPGDRAVREALRQLYRSGEIAAGRTLNHIWIRTKNKKDGEKQEEHAADEGGRDRRT